jgi:sarcosine oxidase, subunit alpha
MQQAHRIERLPGCPIDLGDRVHFQFEGRSIEGHTREPLAMALTAAGVRVFGRSGKYHRPRGSRCLRTHCSGCLMRVDGNPNVRTCETLCREGQTVERQNGWPGVEHDLFRTIDWFYPNGLQHHEMFTISNSIGRLALPFVRRLAASGVLPSENPPAPSDLKRKNVSVVILGGGASGIASAVSLAKEKKNVLLLESDIHLGGRLLDASCGLNEKDSQIPSGWNAVKQLKEEIFGLPTLEVLLGTPALAVYPGEKPLILAAHSDETLLITAERLICCTGAYEQVPLFQNNDLPGIVGLRALDRMVFGYGVLPSTPIAIVGESDQALLLALRLAEQRVQLAGVVTRRIHGPLVESLQKHCVPMVTNHDVACARGGRSLEHIELVPAGQSNANLVLDCGVCAIEAPASPAFELANHAGCLVQFHSEDGYGIIVDQNQRTSQQGIFAAGQCTRLCSVEQAMEQGKRAALSCAQSLS